MQGPLHGGGVHGPGRCAVRRGATATGGSSMTDLVAGVVRMTCWMATTFCAGELTLVPFRCDSCHEVEGTAPLCAVHLAAVRSRATVPMCDACASRGHPFRRLTLLP